MATAPPETEAPPEAEPRDLAADAVAAVKAALADVRPEDVEGFQRAAVNDAKDRDAVTKAKDDQAAKDAATKAKMQAANALAAIDGALAEHHDADARQRAITAAVLGLEPERPSVLLDQRRLLGELMAQGITDPKWLPSPRFGERLFYAGVSFLFSGHKKAGKSWAMALLAADYVEAGFPVVYVDNENGSELFAERLLLMGVPADEVDDRFYYVPFPVGLKLDGLRAEVEAIAHAHPGALIIFDSMRAFMSKFGLDPNRDVEVEQFLGPVMGAVKGPKGHGVTVGTIDHANRKTTAEDDYAQGGSAAKPAAVDVVYYFDKRTPFSEARRGLVRVIAKDDRRGRVEPPERWYWIGGQGPTEHPREPVPLHFTAADLDEVGGQGIIREGVKQFLSDKAPEAQTKTKVRKGVKGDSVEIDKALDWLTANDREPVWTDPSPRGTGYKPVYVFDPEREPPGLAL